MAARDWRDRQDKKVCRDCGGKIEPKRLAAGMRCCQECARTRADDVAARRLRHKMATMTTDQTVPTSPPSPVVRQEFQVHLLNDQGIGRAQMLGAVFSEALDRIEAIIPPGRDRAIVVTKLQEASFFAKRAIAADPVNQEAPREG